MRYLLMSLVAAVAVITSSAQAQSRSSSCGDPALLKQRSVKVNTKTVKLRPLPAGPTFYLLAGEAARNEPHYAILLPADKLTRELRAQNPGTPKQPPMEMFDIWLQRIQADLPLSQHTDLLKYGVPEGGAGGMSALMASWLLSSGEATVVDLWGGSATYLNQVLVADIELHGSKFIEVCDMSGKPFLSVTLVLAD